MTKPRGCSRYLWPARGSASFGVCVALQSDYSRWEGIIRGSAILHVTCLLQMENKTLCHCLDLKRLALNQANPPHTHTVMLCILFFNHTFPVDATGWQCVGVLPATCVFVSWVPSMFCWVLSCGSRTIWCICLCFVRHRLHHLPSLLLMCIFPVSSICSPDFYLSLLISFVIFGFHANTLNLCLLFLLWNYEFLDVDSFYKTLFSCKCSKITKHCVLHELLLLFFPNVAAATAGLVR